MQEIGDWRRQIDAIDVEIVQLLNRRAELALRIFEDKRAAGREVVDPAREAAVMRNLHAANRGPLSAGAIEEIGRTLIGVCRALQHQASTAARESA